MSTENATAAVAEEIKPVEAAPEEVAPEKAEEESVAAAQVDGSSVPANGNPLQEVEYKVEVKLADLQADPNNPLFSAKSFEELKL